MTTPAIDPDAFKAFEQAGWEQIDAAVYDETTGSVTAQAIGPLLDAVRAGPGVRLLDVACGPGRLAAAQGNPRRDVACQAQ